MRKIEEMLTEIEANWAIPRYSSGEGEEGSFKLVCEVAKQSSPFTNPFSFALPPDLIQFWNSASRVDLFKDVEYGQWGLCLFPPNEALDRTIREKVSRPKDFLENDIVIGSFYGDSDLLIIRCDQGPAFGNVEVALPIDPRKDWYAVAPSLGVFLESYIHAEGDKFWE